MYSAERHIINNLFLEVNTHSKETGYYLKDHLDTFLKEELLPLLETYFDTLDVKMSLQSLQIEKLNMDFSVASGFDFEIIKLEIINQFQKQIEKQIEKGFPDSKHYALINNKEKNANEFFNFLETGTAAWWTVSKDILNSNEDNQFEKIANSKAFGIKLLNALKNHQTRNRFIKQLSDEQIYSILKKTFLLELTAAETTSINISQIKDNMNAVISASKQGLNQRNLIWNIVLSQLLKHSESSIQQKLFDLFISFPSMKKQEQKFVLEAVKNQIKGRSVLDVLSNLTHEVLIVTTILEDKALESLQKKNKDESLKSDFKTDESLASNNKKEVEMSRVFDTSEDVKEEENLALSFVLNEEIVSEIPSNYYVNNAGLILIHPFLKSLFENCGLLNKDNSINDPEVAAHLLHYIATEQEQDYEHEMLFEKLLCSIPINQTINRNIILSQELKNQGNEMLRAVLDNWQVMKNASLDLLRNEYLQRPGKIILTGDNPKVLVERKTQDILLDKISWNLGVVKLAWKNKIIFVDW
ncbi:contractile injection system tape measure protein [Flavobacterium sp. MC2016-06]|jgi:hypothetical protein|uniref:contractile injection system tape measure protein n=1 Tax=Flavobacterium sp. MC2016-06 TaxID=2676308 RepID=UPI0012BAF435|nr:contractile injection system tape measure protein [Flavobacterium sp. MC2016-06]MBU3857619.1 hypothetical protein [Flavobacterium sp. MC2016-06]